MKKDRIEEGIDIWWTLVCFFFSVVVKSMSVGARKKYYSELEFTDLLKDDILISYFRAYLLKHDSDNAFRLDFILEVLAQIVIRMFLTQ